MRATPSTASPRIPALHRAIAVERAAVVSHALYARIQTLADVRRFMEHHVFAVWHVMSLLKATSRAHANRLLESVCGESAPSIA